MKVNGKDYHAVYWKNRAVHWVEQRLLPHSFEIVSSQDPEKVALAIETMQVRGAPTIGAAAAFGLALAYQQDRTRFESFWLPRFKRARPTAVNLFHACHAMQMHAEMAVSVDDMADAAKAYADAEVERNHLIGETLAELLAVGKRRILTHCNTGWLAAVDWGTALSGIYYLARSGDKPFVWVDETRPRLQGAKLTAWELAQEGIPSKVQVDGAAAWMIAQGKVDAVVVGADRIATNGDVANKIGTYMLSLAAKEHDVPFYVAAPSSTFDRDCPTGDHIPIEERSSSELLEMDGVDKAGKDQHIQLTGKAIQANNPAFDVTPAANITAIISEGGVWRP